MEMQHFFWSWIMLCPLQLPDNIIKYCASWLEIAGFSLRREKGILDLEETDFLPSAQAFQFPKFLPLWRWEISKTIFHNNNNNQEFPWIIWNVSISWFYLILV